MTIKLENKMPEAKTAKLRIGKLPDLTPVKLTITLDPDIHGCLEDYATIYAESYGEKVKPAELVPSMISGFLATDAGFKKARKDMKAR